MPTATGLNLRHVPPSLHGAAREHFEQGDVLGLLCMADNQSGLDIVRDNWQILKDAGLYERALLEAYIGCRVNNVAHPKSMLDLLFWLADRSRLRDCGSPLPGRGPFVLYRGVAGTGRRRRINGHSWTESLGVACWFAGRAAIYRLADPAIYTTTVTARAVFAYCADRGEAEFICNVRKPTRLALTAEEIRERSDRESDTEA